MRVNTGVIEEPTPVEAATIGPKVLNWTVWGKASFFSQEEAEQYCRDNKLPLDLIVNRSGLTCMNGQASARMDKARSSMRLR